MTIYVGLSLLLHAMGLEITDKTEFILLNDHVKIQKASINLNDLHKWQNAHHDQPHSNQPPYCNFLQWPNHLKHLMPLLTHHASHQTQPPKLNLPYAGRCWVDERIGKKERQHVTQEFRNKNCNLF